MDSITHIFLGGAIGQALANKKTTHKAAILGAVASSAPDFDVFIQSSHHPLWAFEIHRSFTHSLIFIPLGALIVFLFAMLIFKSMRQDWKTYLLVCLLAYGSHCLLDSCTSYGTQLFWPFAHTRVSWDIIPIVEPIFTLCLILGFIWSWLQETRKPALIGLICALIYLGFCAIQHHRALITEEKLIAARKQVASQVRVMPKFADIYSWNGLYISDGRIYLDTIKTPLFEKSDSRAGFSIPVFTVKQLPSNLQTPEIIHAAEVFTWFTQGYTSIAHTKPFVLTDMRYLDRGKHIVGMWGVALIHQQGEAEIIHLSRILIDPDTITANTYSQNYFTKI